MSLSQALNQFAQNLGRYLAARKCNQLEKENPKMEKKKTDWTGFGPMIIAIIVGLFIWGLCTNWWSNDRDSSSQSNSSTVTDGHALAACKRKANIEAPQGFDYKLSNVDITNNNDGTTTIVFSDVLVNNAVTQTIRCDVGGTNDNLSVLSFGAIN